MLYIAILLALWWLAYVLLAEKTSLDAQNWLYKEVYAKEVPNYPFYQIYAHSVPFYTFDEKEWVKSIIISKAREFHIDENLLLRIVNCESGYQTKIKNKKSSASGIFQFLSSTFIEQAKAYGLDWTDKNDPEIQAELAAIMIKDGKISAWNASKTCWQMSSLR